MIAIVSPAKNMRTAGLKGLELTRPALLEKTRRLLPMLRALEPWELESRLKINPQLAMKAFSDFQEFESPGGESPALLSYHGLAYQNLEAESLGLEDFAFAGGSLRILSAFYGVLRPGDAIKPYRLEFQCGFQPGGKSLYHFWGDSIYRELFRNGDTVINLASREYSKTVSPFLKTGDRMITCDFLTFRRGKLITLAALAKMARGRMARFLIDNRRACGNFPGRATSFLRSTATAKISDLFSVFKSEAAMPIPENSGIGSRRLIFQAAVHPDDPPLYFRRYFMIEQGMKAPDFTLEDKDGNQVSLSQFLEQKVILYFYPRDNTPGCTAQACGFRDAYDELQGKAVVIGVSKDSAASHQKFAQKYQLPFVLLSDPQRQAIEAYGVWQEKRLYGKTSMGVARTTFLIDEKGVVEKVFQKVKAAENAREILDYLEG